MNKALEYFNEMVSSNQLDYNDEFKKVKIIRDALTEREELSETTRRALGGKYLMRTMLLQLLGVADLTLEKPEIGGEAIHVKLHDCEFFWTGWGVYWIKENFSYKIKNIK